MPIADRPGSRRLDYGSLVFAVAVAVLVAAAVVISFGHLTDRPSGFYVDESSIAWNAWNFASRGVDEHGRPWPLAFEAFGDWKSAPYIYLVAGAFKLAGPSIEAARAVSAACGLAAVILVAALAWLITRRRAVVLLTATTALLTPWLFEPSRLVFELAILPAFLAAFLLALRAWSPSSTAFPWRAAVLIAGFLALVTYSYQLGRILGPLLAFGLIVYATRRSWRNVGMVWLAYSVFLIPWALLAVLYPESLGSLSARATEAGYLSLPLPDLVATFVRQLAGNLDPVHVFLIGDPNPRHHAPFIGGSLLFATGALAVIGLDRAAHRIGSDGWSRYLLYGLAIAFVPASLTLDEFHVHRLLAVPIFLIVLSIYGQAWLLGVLQGRATLLRTSGFVVLAVATVVQGIWFQVRYDEIARNRGGWFDAEYPRLLDAALATGADPIYLEDGIVPTYVHGYWYGALRGVDPERFVHLPRDARAPSGAVVLSSVTDCTPCEELGIGGFYKLYRIP